MPISILTTKPCNHNGRLTSDNTRNPNNFTMNDQHIPFEANDPRAIHEAARRRMMALFARARITDDQRHELVYAWTSGRTSSSSSLELQEMRDIIWKFENQFDAPATVLYIEAEKKKQRAIVLKIATDTGIKEPENFEKFNRFMLNYSILKKELHRYNLEELYELVKQFRGLERNYQRSAQQPGTKAWHHSNGLPIPSNQ